MFLLKRETGAAGGRHATGFWHPWPDNRHKLSAPAGFQRDQSRALQAAQVDA